jgi:Spy/CpxP family protein refolding chaperone
MSTHGRIGVASGLAVAVLMLGTAAVGVTYAQQQSQSGDAVMRQPGAVMRQRGAVMRQRGAMMQKRGAMLQQRGTVRQQRRLMGGGPMGAVRLGLGQLGLTDDQKQQVRGIMAGHRAEFQALSARAIPAHRALASAIAGGDEATVRQRSADAGAVQTDRALLAAKLRGEILQILTPEQREKAQTLRQQFDQRMDQRRGRRAGER